MWSCMSLYSGFLKLIIIITYENNKHILPSELVRSMAMSSGEHVPCDGTMILSHMTHTRACHNHLVIWFGPEWLLLF